MADELKICKNCVHHDTFRVDFIKEHVCCRGGYPPPVVNLVTGNETTQWPKVLFCEKERKSHIFFKESYCGPEGKFFQPKDVDVWLGEP